MTVRAALFPGHVGRNSGGVDGPDHANGDRLHTIEAVVVDSITRKVARYLRDIGMKHRIGIGSFEDRVADTADCSFGLSVHADLLPADSTIHGFHVIYWPGPDGRELAMEVDAAMAVAVERARKPWARTDLVILRKTRFPTVLVEVGFLSNPEEEADLQQETHQYRIASALAWGLQRYAYDGR